MNEKEVERQTEEKIKQQIKQKLERQLENRLDSLIEFTERLVIDMSNVLSTLNNFVYILVLQRKLTQMEKIDNEQS